MAQLTDREYAHKLGLPIENVKNTSYDAAPLAFRQQEFVAKNSFCAPIAGTTTTGDVAYSVYLGKTTRKITANKVLFHVSTAGSSTQVAEVGLFSSPTAPNRAAQTLTKIVATGTVDDLTGTGVLGNTTSFAREIPAGVHLWAVLRVNMAGTEPTVYGLTADMGYGTILSTSGASALTSVSTLAGAIITAAVAWQAPNLTLSYS